MDVAALRALLDELAAHEVREFLRALEGDPDLDTVILPVGNGEALTYKKP